MVWIGFRPLVGAVVAALLAGFLVVAPAAPVAAFGGNCSGTSVGLTPLTDIGEGYLYTGGNVMPVDHEAAAPAITPINGIIGVAAVGMSNGAQEWSSFIASASARNDLNPAVRLVNGAVGGVTMSQWANPGSGAWDTSVSLIRNAGLSAAEVQVIWMKMGSQLGQLEGSQDQRVEQERQWLLDVLENAKDRFPNLEHVYFSSRIYVGYETSPNHAEPMTGYDNGLSVRAVVADSIAGDTPVWAAWGPYLWADGATLRSDGHHWDCADFEADGVHPSNLGEQKVAGLLMEFFTTTETTCGWFLTNAGGACATGGGSFTDVAASHVFFTEVEWLVSESITFGCNPPANDMYCPGGLVSRGQMAAFLDRALGLPNGPDAFVDDDGSIFEAEINALAAAEITRGCNPPVNNEFCPMGNVTRGQMAAFLVRALGLPPGPERFEDDDGSIFESDIEALAASGITLGCNPPANDRFCPNDSVTRGQMAAFLFRAQGYF